MTQKSVMNHDVIDDGDDIIDDVIVMLVNSRHTWSSCHAMNGQVLQYIDLQLPHANRNHDKMLQKFCYNLNATDKNY